MRASFDRRYIEVASIIRVSNFEKNFVSRVQECKSYVRLRSYVITHNFRFEKYIVCTDAQRDSFVDYRSRPVINYTGYLNNFPINAKRHLVFDLTSRPFLSFHPYLFIHLLTYSSHDKTKRWPNFQNWKSANPFFEPASNSILLPPLPSVLKAGERARRALSPRPVIHPTFLSTVSGSVKRGTRVRVLRGASGNMEGREGRRESNGIERSRIEWCGIE